MPPPRAFLIDYILKKERVNMKAGFKLSNIKVKVMDEVDVSIESIETSFEGTASEIAEQTKVTTKIIEEMSKKGGFAVGL